MAFFSYISPKCKSEKKSPIHRFGVFATESIRRGELIAIWGGHIMTAKQRAMIPKEILDIDYSVQVHEDLYLGPKAIEELDEAEFFNHSCFPNAGVKGQILLVARRDIQEGEEICFDYKTTDTEEMNFLCQCGSTDCRKTITGEAWKDPAFQKKNEGFFSWYLQEKINAYNQEQEENFIAFAQRYRGLKHRNSSKEKGCTEGGAFQL
jgi:uncharacterized protein